MISLFSLTVLVTTFLGGGGYVSKVTSSHAVMLMQK